MAHGDEHGHGHGHEQGHGHVLGRPRERGSDWPRGAPGTRLLFLDAFAGISGDMLVAALLDVGARRDAVDRALAALPIAGYRVATSRVARGAIDAHRFEVLVEEPQPPRSWAEIRTMLDGAALGDETRARARAAFALLAEAEGQVHGVAPDDVHFHEVGAVDSIVDVVAAAAALADLEVTEVLASPLPMGRGFVTTAHGVIPLPAPATVACLRGVPTYDAGIDGELVTPTGAAMVASSALRYVRWPDMRPVAVGWGAGARNPPDRPNALRVVLGEDAARTGRARAFVVLETNVDDASPEITAVTFEKLLEAGALDVWATPVHMKKNRVGTLLAALVSAHDVPALSRTMLAESGSLGVRVREVDRIERPRRIVTVATEYGDVDVKIADGDGLPPLIAPELESCRRAAAAHGVPTREVYASALGYGRSKVRPSPR